jgi:glycolate oxidase iron-sulfur subunit
MRALQAGRLPLSAANVRHIDLCLGCRACESACPSRVRYGALLEATREHIERQHRRSAFQRFLRGIAIEGVFPYPGRMRLVLHTAKALKWCRLDKLLPKFSRDALDLIPTDAKAASLPEVSRAATDSEKRGRVGFISGCVMSVMFGRTNAASVKLLNRLGLDVVTPRQQVCCGALFAHSGNLQKRVLGRRNIAAFENLSWMRSSLTLPVADPP